MKFFFYLKLVLLENVFKTTQKIWKWAGNGRFSYCGDFGIKNKQVRCDFYELFIECMYRRGKTNDFKKKNPPTLKPKSC